MVPVIVRELPGRSRTLQTRTNKNTAAANKCLAIRKSENLVEAVEDAEADADLQKVAEEENGDVLGPWTE